MASRKQIAAARRNIKKAQAAVRAKARKTGSRVKRRVRRAARSTKRRVTRRRSPNRAPVRRRNNSKRSNNKGVVGGFLKKIPLINNPTVRKVFIAAGAVSIIVSVLSLISPRAASAANSTIGRGVIGLATGDVVGAVANVAIPMLSGRGGLGGGSNGGGGGNTAIQGTAGFA